ncbi:DNA replication protein DnaD [Staphylococcus pseudintermedius]|uniref:helix-turn-helix domain-containing protein n=1 Tax=Staphylococcus pseudintermedius TaxID=283734 RepID=UPI001A05E684|nr:helix-turn-helix domain-containing protein [Staphylococcus pseudintermedius]EGQ1786185.1 DNA replication protein DnaD [Staphylococcus pseudintermedius]EGQ2829477.1 DnaD domain protein [Staphylococcus pseudintermedius]EGQ2850724.1 DnaD domain protein [Staphylococcus pseudintermedius]EGQ2931182.1 DnaD domain protein [Staphylococcus pseudintermedius]EGQ3094362.1 DnaD domain protein [Staphylococcus pseudintermedius]
MNEQPNYYSIIPANVRYDKELKPMEIIMYGEITALANKYGYAYASNSYFADLYQVHKKTVSNWINHLKEKGYIQTVVTRNEDMSVKDRKIYITPPYEMKNGEGYPQKNGEGYPQKDSHPIHEKTEENNTSINITSINRDRDETSKLFQLISKEIEMIQNPLKAQELEQAIESFESNKMEIVQVAIDYCKQNNKGINYLIKVLDNWSKEGIKAKEEATKKIEPKKTKKTNDFLEQKRQELFGG